MLTYTQAAEMLREHRRILILTHQSPDGDTLGSAGALTLALRNMGKQAQYVCSDRIPAKYDGMLGHIDHQDMDPDLIVAVDVADAKLLGVGLAAYAAHTDLCIDHHASNTGWAKQTLLEGQAGAACELVALLIKAMQTPITPDIAACLYTGMCTDTGCFRYSNTSPRTLRLAAEMLEAGAPAAQINLKMFEIKTRGRMALERMALDTLRYAYGNQVAVMELSRRMVEESGAEEGDLEGLAPIPRNIEGVRIGITLREKGPADYKVSVRTDETVDASALCKVFGGGGHARASGCRLSGTVDEVMDKLIAAAADFLPRKEDDNI